MVSTHLPNWLTLMFNEIPGESPIFIFELCDAILMVCLVLDWPNDKQRTCVLSVDNQAAVAATVKGSPSSTSGTLMASLFWNLAARWSKIWRIEYVHAKSNHADASSRWCTSSCESERNRRTGDLPNAFSVAFSSRGSIQREDTVFNNER